MFISINWIRDFVNLDGIDIKDLIYKFTMSTAEVEGIIEYGKNTRDVVVAKVLSVENVENSKKLHKLVVDIGDKKVNCICGAPNVKEGIKVAFAKEGSLVNGLSITKTTIAGHESSGMCLSEKELGISDDNSGIMVLDDKYNIGEDIKNIIPIDDIIYEIDNKSLTNRPDLWGHYGIAREIAAITNRKLKPLEVENLDKYNDLKKLDINIEDRNLCYRYTGLTIDNVNKKTSSYKMKTRLTYCGLRPISLLVDMTNYIMLELGQPMHAFDKEFIKKVNVKTLKNDEEFVTLDGNKRSLKQGTLMIYNENKPVAIAGVMGGENTQITDATTSLFLESANFNAVSVRKTASAIALRTDASARYEKTLDPELTKLAIERFVKVLKDEDDDIKVSSSLSDVYVNKYPVITIDISREYINKKIGVNFSDEMIEKVLTSLYFKIIENKNGNFKIEVPSFRATKDVSGKADIIEEISRIYGYDNIVPQTNLWKVEPVKEDSLRELEYNIKTLLAQKYGMSEVHSYVWYDTKLNSELGIEVHDNLKIVNGLSKLDSTLRYNMVPTMLYAIYKNIKNFDEIGVFEIGRTFDYKEKGKDCVENKVLGIGKSSISKTEEELMFEVKSMIENISNINKHVSLSYVCNSKFDDNFIHPVNSYEVKYGDECLGYISVLNPRIKDAINKKSNIVVAQINIDMLDKIKYLDIQYEEISKYQTVDFDLSIIVDKNVSYFEIEKVIKDANMQYLKSYSLIDVYENEEKLKDKKNITIRFNIGSSDKTLTKEEIDEERIKLITNLGKYNMNING